MIPYSITTDNIDKSKSLVATAQSSRLWRQQCESRLRTNSKRPTLYACSQIGHASRSRPRSTRHCTTPDIIRRGVRIGTAHKHQHRLEMRCGRTCREAAVAVNLAPVDGVGVRGADRPTRLLTTAVMQLKRWQQTTRSATCSSGCSHRRPRRQPRSKTYAITAHGSRARLGASRSRAEQVAAAVVEAGLGADAAAGLDRTQDGVLS